MQIISGDNLPIYRTNIPVANVPWDSINNDLLNQAAPLAEIDNGLSTLHSNLRRDLEPWAEDYRNVQMQVVSQFMPYAKKYVYPTWLLGNWINKTFPDGILNMHHHRPCDIATVWYLDVPEHSGNFVMYFEGQEYVVPIKTGDYMAFPASILHRTEVNFGTSPRIIMGGNIVWHETLKNDLLKKMAPDKVNSYINNLYETRQLELIKSMSNWYKEHYEKNTSHIFN